MKMWHKRCGGEVVEKGGYYPHIWIATDGKVGRYPPFYCTVCKKKIKNEHDVKGRGILAVLQELLDRFMRKPGKISDWDYPPEVEWEKTKVLEGVIVEILKIRDYKGGNGENAILRCKDGELRTIWGYATLWPIFELKPGVLVKVTNLGMIRGKIVNRSIRSFNIEVNVGNIFDLIEPERLF